ncbi:MAG: FmdB family zinc ribbon protein [Planctomycetota bacterium]
MPMYVYEIIDNEGNPTGETFEVMQSMKDDPLKKHPETGQPVRRTILAPNIGGKSNSMLSNDNLSRLGFTKYEKKGTGYMERVAGNEGPPSIALDDD